MTACHRGWRKEGMGRLITSRPIAPVAAGACGFRGAGGERCIWGIISDPLLADILSSPLAEYLFIGLVGLPGLLLPDLDTDLDLDMLILVFNFHPEESKMNQQEKQAVSDPTKEGRDPTT